MMNKEDEDRQMRETRSLLQMAGQRNASLDIRREALRRLISLTHTPSTELKVYAAQNFSHYFKDFPDLEEDVIDSVYDICEDPDAQVRIEGYKAIVALSTEAKKWTRRNTDVLVQLLQSDEPHELAEIKAALISHLNLDAAAAVGVMCDHCSLDPDLGIEEQEDKRRLRSIVLHFFATEAKKHIFPHFRGPNSEPERVFREGLIKAIAKADVRDTEIIVKDLLLPLGSYPPRSQHGDELLRALLEKVKLIFTELKSKPGPVSLLPVKPYLVLMERIVESGAADPGALLRFYSMAMIGKIALQKLDQESQLVVIEKLAVVLEASEDKRLKYPQDTSSEELLTLRNTVVDACPHILDSMSRALPVYAVPWKACIALLKACRQRHQNHHWDPPRNFVHSVQELNTRAGQVPQKPQDFDEDIQQLLNDLHIQPNKRAPVKIMEPSSPHSGSKRKFDSELRLSTSSQENVIFTKYADDRPHAVGKESRLQLLSTSAQGSAVAMSSSRGSKLINRLGGDISVGERSSTTEAPTLLRRMSSDTKASNGAQANIQPVPESFLTGLASPPQAVPLMLNIKGAASKLLAKEISPPQSPTLIDRMQADSGFSNDSQASRKKKKRSKTGG